MGSRVVMGLAKFLAFKFPANFMLAILVVAGILGGAIKYAYEANLDASKQKIELETKTKQLDQQRIELNELRQRVEDGSRMLDGKLFPY